MVALVGCGAIVAGGTVGGGDSSVIHDGGELATDAAVNDGSWRPADAYFDYDGGTRRVVTCSECPMGSVCVKPDGGVDGAVVECTNLEVPGCLPATYPCFSDRPDCSLACTCAICGAQMSLCGWDSFLGPLISVTCGLP